jgi:hypothetical protein
MGGLETARPLFAGGTRVSRIILGGTGLRPVVSGVTPETDGEPGTNHCCVILRPPAINLPWGIQRDTEFDGRDALATHSF